MSPSRVNHALLVSLLVHGLLLSLTFAGGGGLGLPWQARSAEAPELRVVLQPDAAAALPEQVEAPAVVHERAELDVPAPMMQDTPPAPPTEAPPVLTVERPVAVWAVPAASAASVPSPSPSPSPFPAPAPAPAPTVAALSAASAPTVERLSRPADALRARGEREAAERSAELARVDAARQDIKAAPAVLAAASAPVVETLRRVGGTARVAETRERATELAQLDLARGDIRSAPAMLAAASSPALEALRRPIDLQRPRQPEGLDRTAELARVDAQQGVARIETARNEALRQEAARADAARQETARQEAARAEAARQEAARADAARLAAARQEAARLEGVRQEGLRVEAARLAAVQAQAQAEEEQREARKRAIGRQLDEEAARRDAQREAERQRPDWVPARRGRLFGRTDANADLVAYGETWARKIQSNVGVDEARAVARQPHTDAIVTVAVRSNGSVESITFVRSSGVPAVDEAIQRIVRGQENYPAFPAALLRDFDVVEIRRTWHFDTAVRLD
ncbi:MAG TPA: TonB family protein [Roseateles sp.]